MLSDYKDIQNYAYNIFVNDILNNCVTHAYLIDENNYIDSYKLVLAFVKSLLCDNNYIDAIMCSDCYLCKRIDDGNYPELKVIKPDGMFIKKQQIIELQQEFSRTAVEGKKRIYIIRECEKMRPEAANSMLKFLEEPVEGIIAILMTNNINNILSTIVSRCRIVKLSNSFNEQNVVESELEDLAINFIYGVENRGIDLIIDIKNVWFDVVGPKDRNKMMTVFDVMIDIYYDMMKLLSENRNIKYEKWIDKIEDLSKMNKLDDILNKINLLVDYKDSIKFNVNSNLLMDSVIISIGGINDGSRY